MSFQERKSFVINRQLAILREHQSSNIEQEEIYLLIIEMNFKMRNFKENKLNYNSMVQFPRNVERQYDIAQPGKFKQLEASFTNVAESICREKQNTNTNFIGIHNRLDALQFKLLQIERENPRGVVKYQPLRDMRASTIQSNADFALLRQTVQSDLTLQREQLRKIDIRSSRLENEFREWARQNNQVNMSLVEGNEYNKQRKYDYQFEGFKNSIAAIQRKMEEQEDKKQKSESAIRQLMKKEIVGLKEELRQESTSDKQGSGKYIKELKDAVKGLKEMMGTDRENIKEAIREIQMYSQTNLAKMGNSLQKINLNSIDRYDKLQKKISHFKEEWVSFRLVVNQKLQENKAVVMNIESNTLDRLENTSDGCANGEQMENIQEQLEEWKKLTEKKNLNVFKEISNALKIQRMEWRREHDELSKGMTEIQSTIKQLRKNVDKDVKKQVQSLVQVINEEFDVLTKEMEEINVMIAVSKKETEKFAQDQIHSVLEELQRQNETWTAQISKKMKQIKQGLVVQITQASCTQDKKLKEANQSLKEVLNNQIVDSVKKIDSSVESLHTKIQTNLTNQRSQTSKQISKATDQITALMGEWSGKLKKDCQNGDDEIKNMLETLKKQNSNEITTVKQSMEQLKTKSTQKVTDVHKKIDELKISFDQSVAQIAKNVQDQKIKTKKLESGFEPMKKQLSAEMSKQRKYCLDEIFKIKNQLESKMKTREEKLLAEITGKKQSEIKNKEEEAKQRTVEFDKKIGESLAKVKAEFNAELNKQKTVHNEEITKLKVDIDAKIKVISDLKQKKQAQGKARQQQIRKKKIELQNKAVEFDKKLQASIVSLKKDLQKQMMDQTVKTKGEIDVKINSLNLQNSKKQTEIKNKQLEVDKKLQGLISTAKKEILSVTINDRKMLGEDIAKLGEEIKKTKTESEAKFKLSNDSIAKVQSEQKVKAEEFVKKIQNLKLEIEKKIAEIKGVSLESSKANQAQSLKIQEQKLQALKSSLSKAMDEKNKALLQKITISTSECQSTKALLSGKMIEVKQALNKIQANVFSDRQKHKIVYEKMSSDMRDITDSISTILIEIGPK